MIVITGAAGFIGSCLVARLNELGHYRDLIVVDDFYQDRKDPNLNGKFIREWIHRDIFLDWLEKSHKYIDFVFHLGARTDTTEPDWSIFQRLNLDYSQRIWNICTAHSIPLVYASSAATYGNGEHGYRDDHSIVKKLEALNPYGRSKLLFDQWALKQKSAPPRWAGLKFFNVYGPNEYHKGRMASVVYHGYGQIVEKGQIRLFRSHRDDYRDGEQSRDFIYVKDVVDMCLFFMEKEVESGLYNIGTGKARSFNDLANSVFSALAKKPKIEYFDMPEDLREQYQYFTEASMEKLLGAGYDKPIHTLEEGIRDYVKGYLVGRKYY